jgi:hypothetical protein
VEGGQCCATPSSIRRRGVALSGAHALMRHASLSRSELWRSARASQVTIVSALRL